MEDLAARNLFCRGSLPGEPGSSVAALLRFRMATPAGISPTPPRRVPLQGSPLFAWQLPDDSSGEDQARPLHMVASQTLAAASRFTRKETHVWQDAIPAVLPSMADHCRHHQRGIRHCRAPTGTTADALGDCHWFTQPVDSPMTSSSGGDMSIRTTVSEVTFALAGQFPLN